MLMNPFGFVVGTGFSGHGITSLALMATDALVFQDQDNISLLLICPLIHRNVGESSRLG